VTTVNFQSDYEPENIAADLEIAMETDARLEKAKSRKAELRAIVQEHDIVFGIFKGDEYANGYDRHMIKGAGTVQLIGQVPEERRNVSRTYTIIALPRPDGSDGYKRDVWRRAPKTLNAGLQAEGCRSDNLEI
jgi:hypothetical protein